MWDWLVTFPAEWERIWKREKNIVTFLYLGSRYYSLAVMSYLVWMYVSNFDILPIGRRILIIDSTPLFHLLGTCLPFIAGITVNDGSAGLVA